MPVPLPTVLLRHDTRAGGHYDWMLAQPDHRATPATPDNALWTARVALPSEQWRQAGVWMLDVLPPHRAAYLTRQGDIGNSRGTVLRVDHGHHLPRLITPARWITCVQFERFHGLVELQRLTADRWRATLLDSPVDEEGQTAL